MNKIALFLLLVALGARFATRGSVEPPEEKSAAQTSKTLTQTILPKPISSPKQSAKKPPVAAAQPDGALTLTADQEASLSDSREREDDWSDERESFFRKGLGLSANQMESLKHLRESAEKKEDDLISQSIGSFAEREKIRENIVANRQTYFESMRRLLGPAAAQEYEAYYRRYWKISNQPLTSPHLPL